MTPEERSVMQKLVEEYGAKLVGGLFSVVLTIALTIAWSSHNRGIRNEVRIAQVEVQKMDESAALRKDNQLLNLMNNTRVELKQEIQDLPRPPQWLDDAVKRIERAQEAHTTEIAKLRTEIAAHVASHGAGGG